MRRPWTQPRRILTLLSSTGGHRGFLLHIYEIVLEIGVMGFASLHPSYWIYLDLV